MRLFIFIGIIVVLVSFVANSPGTMGLAGELIVNTPWWAYFVLAGIIYSGYRAAVHINEDKKVDQAFIEEEGKIYIERMEQERERRKASREH